MPFASSPRKLAFAVSVALGLVTGLAACGSRGTRIDLSGAGPANPGRAPAEPANGAPGAQSAWDDIPPTPLVSPSQAWRFVGSDACRECHPREFEEHASSFHARTLRRVREGDPATRYFAAKQRVTDPTRNSVYTTALRDGRGVFRVNAPGRPQMELAPQWVFGSGTQAHTFMFQKDPERVFMEGRISYFTRRKKWDWTVGQEPPRPGSDSPMGRLFQNAEHELCFLCHSTTVVVKEDGIHPEESRLNVGCERCHGPGAEHIRSARAGRAGEKIYGFLNASGERILRLCAACHRGPGVLSDEEIPYAENTYRFTGTALAASRCFRETSGGLSCVTCHNPHRSATRDPIPYIRACKGCHTPSRPERALCRVNRETGCISCHMPARQIGNLVFHNHWIHAARPGRPARQPAGGIRPADPHG